MSKLIKDLQAYIQHIDPSHSKHIFFSRIISLLNDNLLTVSSLTDELAKLSDDQRNQIFKGGILGKASIDTSEALWIVRLYRLLGINLDDERLIALVEQKPSVVLQTELRDARYHAWQRSPFNPQITKALEHELKGALGLKDKGTLVELFMANQPTDFIGELRILLNRAPAYVPQLLVQMHQRFDDKLKLGFITFLLGSSDKQIIEALLHSSPEIVTRLVEINPEYFFKASESMRFIVQKQLSTDTLHQVKQVAAQLFPEDANLKQQYMSMLLDGSYRYKEARLSQSEQSLIAIRQYLELNPGDYKFDFFSKLFGEIATKGLTVDLLQEHLKGADAEELFAKWYGASYSRAAGLMANLYKMATFGTELSYSEMSELTKKGNLPAKSDSSDRKPGQSGALDWLQGSIAKAIEGDVDQLIAQDQRHLALTMIQTYLDQKPGQYKTDFFKNLAVEIDQHGLSLELLQRHLTQADNNQLFAKWSGLGQSRAAEVMANLYQCVSLGRALEGPELQHMVNEKKLPELSYNPSFIINSKIREIIMNPDRANSSYLSIRIGSAIEELQAKARMMLEAQHNVSLSLEASYQEMLINKGLELASTQEHPIFDTQGHVLVFVELKEADFQKLLSDSGWEKAEGRSAEDTFKSMHGVDITTPTLCNLDIKSNDLLKTKFRQWLGNDAAFQSLINSEERASIIDLQEEMVMHTFLSLRTLFKTSPSLNFVTASRDLLPVINELVQAFYRQALTKAYNSANNVIDFEVLNAELDKARKSMAPLCRNALVDKLVELNPDVNWDEQMKSIRNNDFTSTTATGLDYLRSDARNHTVVRIGATEHTAHHKVLGRNTQAIRVIYRNHYDPVENKVTKHSNQTLEARVPSIAVKESSTSVGVKDVANKLRESHQLLRRQAAHTGGPMVYNLLTSLHTVLYDNFFFERPNKQRLSAEYILKGAHLYNLGQLRLGEPQELVYVQNIPVNQHTNRLDDNAFDDVTKEATFMTDIAMLSTLSHYAGKFPSLLQQSIDSAYSMAHSKYLAFLPSIEQGQAYFHQSHEGVLVNRTLDHLKKQWEKAEVPLGNDSLNTIVIKALFKMYASNEYRNKQFGMLVQSLSVFIEPMSQAGCKSANERYQGVSGRVELLKSISYRAESELSQEERAVVFSLADFISGRGTCAQVQEALDKAYNKHNLYGAATAISKEDQGAASKVKATKNKTEPGVITELDTNIAETGFLTRLHQSFCSEMQAHKAKLGDVFKHLFHERGQSPQQGISLR